MRDHQSREEMLISLTHGGQMSSTERDELCGTKGRDTKETGEAPGKKCSEVSRESQHVGRRGTRREGGTGLPKQELDQQEEQLKTFSNRECHR